jgi:hypothetical protein
MNAIVYRNTGISLILASPLTLKQRSLFHWLFVPLRFTFPLAFGRPLPKNLVFKAVMGGVHE